uniref:Uncharacterized protein n=1 Tax=Arundo donax TaxID=35708 RepID=A0A0A9AE11_ARUDO
MTSPALSAHRILETGQSKVMVDGDGGLRSDRVDVDAAAAGLPLEWVNRRRGRWRSGDGHCSGCAGS